MRCGLNLTNLAHYAKVVKENSLARQLIKAANKITSEALEGDDELEATLVRAEHALALIRANYAHFGPQGKSPLAASFSDFMGQNFEDGEIIAFEACRGEIALVQSVTNHGKSTLIRNAVLALVTGGALPPIVDAGPPRSVLLLNLEGSGGRFQSDLRVMTRDFTPEETGLVNENLYVAHRPVLSDGHLSLSRHLRLLEREARKLRVDVIVIDTASKAFAVRNKNDNAEIANCVMKPLDDLACRLNCLVVLVHHIGKAKAEEGATREQAHRGRGASAWADFSSSIFNLEADAQDQARVTLTCGKRKSGGDYEYVLRLDRESRWFRAIEEMSPKLITNDDLVLEALRDFGRSEVRTGEVEKALAGKVKRRTLMDCLNRLADAGQIESARRGWWSVVELCASCAILIRAHTTCTNCGGGEKACGQLDLNKESHLSPNGQGPKGGEHVIR